MSDDMDARWAAYTDARGQTVDPEKWAEALWRIAEGGNVQALQYIANRIEGMPRQQTDGPPSAALAQSSAQALVVMVDGKAVESVEAQRADAMAMLGKFTQKREPERPAPPSDP